MDSNLGYAQAQLLAWFPQLYACYSLLFESKSLLLSSSNFGHYGYMCADFTYFSGSK